MSINSPIKYKKNDYFYSINDPEYQGQLERLILSNFKDSVHGSKYLKQLNNASYDTNCVRGDLKLQNQQNLVASYINSTTPYRGLILWHGIGSGKTLSSILISKKTTNTHNVIGIIPAMLIDNFREELIGTKLKRKSLIYDDKTFRKIKKINTEIKNIETEINRITKRKYNNPQNQTEKINKLQHKNVDLTKKRKTIKEYEELISEDDYNKFFFSTSNGNINTFDITHQDISKFENSLLILDESQIIISKINNGITQEANNARAIPRRQQKSAHIRQNMLNIPNANNQLIQATNAETRAINQKDSFVRFYEKMCSLNNIKIVCLSGTPIISDVRELAILFNLLYGSKTYFNIDTINNNINGNILINIITNKNKRLLNSYLDSQTIQNPTKILYNEFIKHIDFSKSTVQQTLVSIFINPEKYENQFDPLTDIYIGMKYVNTSTAFSIEQFLTTLNIQHNGPEVLYLFDTSTFNRDYSLLNIPEFNEKTRNGYRLSSSNDERLQYLNTILNPSPGVDSINNQDLFIEKTRGLLSYFGNIDNLMPDLNIYDSDKVQTPPVQYNIKSNDSIRCKIGYNNNGQPLYNIKICNMIILNSVRTSQYEKIRVIRTPPTPSQPDSSFILTLGISKLKNNAEHFIYPSFDYNIQITYYTDVFNTCFNNYLSVYALDRFRQLEDIKKYKNSGIIPEEPKTKEFIDNFLNKDFNYLNQFNLDQSNNPIHTLSVYSDEHIKNIWNISDFSTTTSKDMFRITNLMEYSVKFYYIIRCIIENPDDLHVVYIEYRQIIIPFVRALQANGFTPFINDNNIPGGGKMINPLISNRQDKKKTKKIDTPIDRSNKYMFLTGAEQSGQNSDDHRFLKHLLDPSEGKTDPDKKQEYIDIFNSKGNINGKKIRIVILNSAAAEGITLKNVRYIHMLHPPSNMSRLFQIFGRGIRTCSHYALNDTDRNVTPFLYISSYGSDYLTDNDMTDDEKNFEKIVSKNDRNLPYLQILKNNAIDKVLFNAQESALLPNPVIRSISHNKTKKRSFDANSNSNKGNKTRKRLRIRS